MHQLMNFVGGTWVEGVETASVRDAFTDEVRAEVHQPSREQVSEATRAVASAQESDSLSPHDRYTVLAAASQLVAQRRDSFVEAIVADSGFTVSDANREVDRAVETLLLSGEEAKRLAGEVVPIGADPKAPARIAFTLRRPVGVVCAITPFNSPLNTVCHKVAPALAGGNGVILKPAGQTPQAADLLVRTLLDAGLPPGLIALLHGDGATTGQWLLEDPVPAFYAFTGSTGVGEHIHRTIGARRSQLELGSLASTIVCEDADINSVAKLVASAAFRKSGQVCTSVQRLYVDSRILGAVTEELQAELADKHAGDPRDPASFIGPVIDDGAADRISAWVQHAVEDGADLVHGGQRSGRLLEPTVLTSVTPTMEVMCNEVFGPVVVIRPFSALDQALDEADYTPYGLAAGIFTNQIDVAFRAARRLRVGTLHVNETSSARVDLMPFGGVKASGFGTEGPAYAIREMTEEMLITLPF